MSEPKGLGTVAVDSDYAIDDVRMPLWIAAQTASEIVGLTPGTIGVLWSEIPTRDVPYGPVGYRRFVCVKRFHEAIKGDERAMARLRRVVGRTWMKTDVPRRDFDFEGDIDELRGCPSGVYVIRCETSGARKIGMSENIPGRLRGHARDINSLSSPLYDVPGPLTLAAIYKTKPDLAPALEAAIHWLYRKSRRGSVEVFDIRQDERPPESFRDATHVLETFVREATHGKP